MLNEHGDERTGSGFHIGDGYIVTAAHVVENHLIKEIAVYESHEAATIVARG